MPDSSRRRDLVVGAVGGLLAVALVLGGVLGTSGPSSTPLPAARHVLIVSIPGLRWQDLAASSTPNLDDHLDATALLSVRSIGPETSLVEGYLAVNAGNRLDAEPATPAGDVAVEPDASGVGACAPDLVARAVEFADDDLNGAEPGALGEAFAAIGVTTSVHGSRAAVAALMGADGCVDAFDRVESPDALDPTKVDLSGAGVTLVELLGLEAADTAAARAAALDSIEDALGRLVVPDDVLVVVLAPSATADAAEVTVAAVGGAGLGTGTPRALVSPSTRRADYVTLIDVAPAVIEVLGGEVPASMSGTAIAVASGVPGGAGDRRGHLADLAERVELRDRAVGPVSVVLVVLIVLCAVAALGRRDRLARTLAPIVVAYPTVAFLAGATAYHQLPLDFLVVAIPVVAAAVAAVVVASSSRWGAWAPVTVLATVLWVVLVVDVVTGGWLQINTPLGYTPTIAGRFQGFGNLSFGLAAAAALAVGLLAACWPQWRVSPAVWAAAVGAVTTVVVAAPAYGSDVGGTLAVVPAFAVLVLVVAGRRLRPRTVLLAVVGATVAVLVLAVVDRARPAESRTHLGRFLDELLDGDGSLVIRRKLRGNLAILTSSFWSILLLGLIVVAAVAVWRRRQRLAAQLAGRPVVRAFVAGFAVVAALGFALNDSGIAVPAIMLAVVVPWLVGHLVPVTTRAGR